MSKQLRLTDPTIIVTAPPEEDRWGYYQFPRISRLPSDDLLVTFQVADDSAHSYGKDGTLSFLSVDEGENWQPTRKIELCKFHGAIELDNGEWISLRMPKAARYEDLDLPDPVDWTAMSYDGVGGPAPRFLFSEMDSKLHEIPLSIYRDGEWIEECGTINNPSGYWVPSEGLFPIIFIGQLRKLSDGSLLAGVYPYYHDCFADCKSGIAFYHSVDAGKSWQLRGDIPYVPDLEYDDKAELRQGFTELSFVVRSDDSLLCVMRTTDASPGMAPLYFAVSQDGGASWTKPKVIAPYGVEPKLLQLNCGALVLSAGRPGVYARVSLDGRGESWELLREIVSHKMVDPRGDSCGYSELVALSDDSFLCVYSLFGHQISPGVFSKAIAVRKGCLIDVKESDLAEVPPSDEIEIRYYQDGTVFKEIGRATGKAHGYLKTYYRDGTVAAEVPFRDGKRHGLQKQYERDGSLMRTVTWDMGNTHGPIRAYDSYGNLFKEHYRSTNKAVSHECWWDNNL